jgi:hypothetical protein
MVQSMADLLLNNGCIDAPPQKMGLLLIDTQSLCQVAYTHGNDTHHFDLSTYFEKLLFRRGR